MLSLLVWVAVGGLNHFIGSITGVIILRGIAEVFGGLREYEMILKFPYIGLGNPFLTRWFT